MIRYEVIIGAMILNGRSFPIVLCEILAESMVIAELIAEDMGYPDAKIRPTLKEYIHPEWNLN